MSEVLAACGAAFIFAAIACAEHRVARLWRDTAQRLRAELRARREADAEKAARLTHAEFGLYHVLRGIEDETLRVDCDGDGVLRGTVVVRGEVVYVALSTVRDERSARDGVRPATFGAVARDADGREVDPPPDGAAAGQQTRGEGRGRSE